MAEEPKVTVFVEDPYQQIVDVHFVTLQYLCIGMNIIRTCSLDFQRSRLFRQAQDYTLEAADAGEPEEPNAVPSSNSSLEVTLRWGTRNLFMQDFDGGLGGWQTITEPTDVPAVGLYSRPLKGGTWTSVAQEGFASPGTKPEKIAKITGLRMTLPMVMELSGAIPATGSEAVTTMPQVAWFGASEGGSMRDKKGNPIRAPNDGPIFGDLGSPSIGIVGVGATRMPGHRVSGTELRAYSPEKTVGFLPEAAWIASDGIYDRVFASTPMDLELIRIEWDKKNYRPIGGVLYDRQPFDDNRPDPPRTLFILFKAIEDG